MASLTGNVLDITGARVAGTYAELSSETSPQRVYKAQANESGEYRFVGLLSDDYKLTLMRAGFKSLKVRSIRISDREHKVMPVLTLDVASSGCGNGRPVLDYLRFLSSATHTGDFGGSVRLDRGTVAGPPVVGADVTLICAKGKVCGHTVTDAMGDFSFNDLPPNEFTVRVTRSGYYPLEVPGYLVMEGLASTYYPEWLERCPRGNCDPQLRPKRPLAICE